MPEIVLEDLQRVDPVNLVDRKGRAPDQRAGLRLGLLAAEDAVDADVRDADVNVQEPFPLVDAEHREYPVSRGIGAG